MNTRFKFTALALAVACVGAGFAMGAKASPHHHHDHDSHARSYAPIGVMGDHPHQKGEWMFSYRYMYMDMQGNRDGDDSLSPEEVVTFPNENSGPSVLRVVPTEMTMEMHMLGGMYAPSNTVTLMLMTNFIKKDMDHITFQGMTGNTRLGQFSTRAEGISDTSLSALVRLSQKVHATVGVSLPTGSTDEEGEVLTPMNTNATLRLPYPMQLGSGTYDLILGVTLNEHFGRWAYGSQFKAIIRTGENDEDYTLGDEIHASSWVSYALSNSFSVNSRVAYLNRWNIDGQDDTILAPVQTADPSRQAVDRIDLNVGLSWLARDNKNRLALELGAPVYQKLDGPQLETDLQATLGWQYAF